MISLFFSKILQIRWLPVPKSQLFSVENQALAINGNHYVFSAVITSLIGFVRFSDNAQPVCLPTQDDLVSNATNCYITGFGSIVQSLVDRKS